MGTLPRTKNEQIAFFEQRLPLWNANAAALGLSLPHLTELATQTTTARTDFDAAQVARAASTRRHRDTGLRRCRSDRLWC